MLILNWKYFSYECWRPFFLISSSHGVRLKNNKEEEVDQECRDSVRLSPHLSVRSADLLTFFSSFGWGRLKLWKAHALDLRVLMVTLSRSLLGLEFWLSLANFLFFKTFFVFSSSESVSESDPKLNQLCQKDFSSSLCFSCFRFCWSFSNLFPSVFCCCSSINEDAEEEADEPNVASWLQRESDCFGGFC